MWWHPLINSELRRRTQEGHKCEISLDYIARPCLKTEPSMVIHLFRVQSCEVREIFPPSCSQPVLVSFPIISESWFSKILFSKSVWLVSQNIYTGKPHVIVWNNMCSAGSYMERSVFVMGSWNFYGLKQMWKQCKRKLKIKKGQNLLNGNRIQAQWFPLNNPEKYDIFTTIHKHTHTHIWLFFTVKL